MTEFTQLLHATKTYTIDHLDVAGDDLPVTSKPSWSVAHAGLDGLPSCGTLETSVNGHSAKFHAQALGSVKITVVASASPSANVTAEFTINVVAHPSVRAGSQFTVVQGPDRRLH
jgi:hypothetical protein